MAEHNYSLLAAELGRRGGKASKRGPGSLRRILEGVCAEIGSMDNRDVFIPRAWNINESFSGGVH